MSEFLHSLIAGGAAGTAVDVALFPLDTVKTRLQDPRGFRAAGGFAGIYRGLLSATLGSAPVTCPSLWTTPPPMRGCCAWTRRSPSRSATP